MNQQEFIEQCKNRNINLTDPMLEQLDKYALYLKDYNEKINLTAITEYEEVLDKHFFDSLLCVKQPLQGTLVDIGTGAGFPGVVLKIVYPELKVVLVEPMRKRCVFLESLIKLLNLKDIQIVNARGEEYAKKYREKYDYVTARAVTGLNKLIEICGALVKKDGYFICLRGLNGRAEIEEASSAIKTMGFEIESITDEFLFNGDQRVISYFKKISNTPNKYPRQYSIILKQPL